MFSKFPYSKYFVLLLIAYLGCCLSCKEVLPTRVVTTTSLDTTFLRTASSAPQKRMVLLEEFTGASCPNCPDGHRVVHKIDSLYQKDFVTYSLHHGTLAKPVTTGDPDFRLEESATIASTFGSNAMPTALIDRTKNNNNNFIFGRNEWMTLVQNRLLVPVKQNIVLSVRQDANNQKYYLTIEVEFLEETTNSTSYTVVMAEDGIIADQIQGSIILPKYNHKGVSRKFYTGATGSILNKPTGSAVYEKGRVYKKEIELTTNPSWKVDKLYVAVHLTDEASKEVLQAAKIKVQQ